MPWVSLIRGIKHGTQVMATQMQLKVILVGNRIATGVL